MTDTLCILVIFFCLHSIIAIEFNDKLRQARPNLLLDVSKSHCNLNNSPDGPNMCIGFSIPPADFRCQPSEFQCLSTADQASCTSVPSDSSQQHCLDGSDAAFFYLSKESFWQLGPTIPTNVSNRAEAYLQLELKPMPTQIRQWLSEFNSTMIYLVQFYRTTGAHVTTSLAQSAEPAPYPLLGASIRLPGPLIDSNVQQHSSECCIVVIELSVVSASGLTVAVSPALTNQFAVAMIPPKLISSSLLDNLKIDSLTVYGVNGKSQVRVQIEAVSTEWLPRTSSSGNQRVSILLNWRCNDKGKLVDNIGSQELFLLADKSDSEEGDTSRRYLLDSTVTLANTSNFNNCKFWIGNNASLSVGVSSSAPEFSVELDFYYGVNATADGGLDVAWRVPDAWTEAYPPKLYNFTIDYWAHLCGRSGSSLNGLRSTTAKLSADMLNPATKYWISVRACDARGCGPRSGYAIARTAGPPIPPVDLISADLFNGTNLMVAWRVGPVSAGWPAGKSWLVSLYYDTNLFRVMCSDRLATDPSVVQSLSAKVRLDHLQGCSLYSMRVQVTDPAGLGPASPIYLQTTGLRSTSPPKNVRYVYPYRGNGSQALITWNAPCVIVFKPVAYVLKVTNMFTEDTKEFYIDETSDSVIGQVVDELEAGRLYRLMVLTNAVGGQSSVPVVLKTDAFVGTRNISAQLAPVSESSLEDRRCAVDTGSNSSLIIASSASNLIGCQVAVSVRWLTDVPRLLSRVSRGRSKDMRLQYEVYGKLSSAQNSNRSTSTLSTKSSVGDLWYKYSNAGLTADSFDIVAYPCLTACPRPTVSLTYEIRTRVLIQFADDSDQSVIASSFSNPALLELADNLPLMTPISCHFATEGFGFNVTQLVAIAIGSVSLVCLVLASLLLRRRLQRRRRLRRSQLLLSEAYDDAFGNLFPEHAASTAVK